MSIPYYCLVGIVGHTLDGFCADQNNVPLNLKDEPSTNKEIHIIIKNKNKKDLNVLIKPELPKPPHHQPDDYKKTGWMVLTVPGASDEAIGVDAEFRISADQLGEFDYYSITGETNPFTPVGTCYNLEMGKCYRLEFTNNIFGTDCIGTEITKPLVSPSGSLKILPSKKILPTPRTGVSRLPDRPSEVLTHGQ